MVVTELALLRLRPGTTAQTPSLLVNLLKAKNVMEHASKSKFHYYHCVEDPEVIYIIGAWSSVRFHMDEFIPSQANQELLALLKDQVSVEWMFHVDVDQDVRPLPLDAAAVLAIGRHIVKDNEKQIVQETFNENKLELDAFAGGTDKVVGGWRIDQGYDPGSEGVKDEFVLFTGWESVERHHAFATTEGFQKYSKIRDRIEVVDIKHAIKLEV